MNNGLGSLIRPLLAEGLPYREIAQRLNCSKASVAYHSRKLRAGLVQPEASKRYDWAAIQAFHDEGHTRTECRKYFGFNKLSWYRAIQRGDIVPRPLNPKPLEALAPKNRGGIKKRLLAAGTPYVCGICGIFEWLGKALSLQLDHINGDTVDNSHENLRLLCPNCHSQTDPYGGRNVGRFSRVV